MPPDLEPPAAPADQEGMRRLRPTTGPRAIPSPRTTPRAFTLLELMIVLACLATAGLLVMPTFSDAGDVRLRSAARMLAADLAYAQADSLGHGDDPRVVVFDVAAGSYLIAPRSTPAVPITDPVGGLPHVTRFGAGRAGALPGVSIAGLSVGDDSTLGFGPQGELDQVGPASITLACGRWRVTLTVSPTTGDVSVGPLIDTSANP